MAQIDLVLKKPFAQQVAFFRSKLGNLVPTAKWDDLQKTQHDTAFMVAGALKADLLADLAMSIDKAISQGTGLEAWRKDFKAAVEKHDWHGWTGESTKAGKAWRTRVTYQTNMQTSYAAGRFAQLQEGGFDYWVYHHSDGVKNPRAQHLAWDGMARPADDPFWQTHYPPNGWGCQCYVTGARSKEIAEMQGADFSKKPPEGLEGIHQGWSYAPGESVANTVRVMAEKTRQWQYELAKAYMENLPEALRDQYATSYRSLPSVADDTRRYAQRILENYKQVEIPPYQTMGLLTSKDIVALKKHTGIEVVGFDFALDSSAVRHTFDHHGDNKTEAKRGQRAVLANDYSYIPELLSAPDNIVYVGDTDNSQPLMRYQKRINGELYQAVFGVRRKRKMLSLKTFYIGVE